MAGVCIYCGKRHDFDYIDRNIENIRGRINESAVRSGRKGENILLVAVTKTIDICKILHAYKNGITDFGENKVQEFREKYDILNELNINCNWHIIGHLQSNKAKYIAGKTALVHSIDSFETAKILDVREIKESNILLQVNVSSELSKSGIEMSKVPEMLYQLSNLKNLKVKGLMTIAPLEGGVDVARPVFRKLYKIFVDNRQEKINNIDMDILSMGMSGDFEAAIEEGSNLVRIGTAIFGAR